MKHYRAALILIPLLAALFLISHFHLSAAEFEQHVKDTLPLGSTRGQVQAFLASEPANIEQAGFDYAAGHPYQGRILIVRLKPPLSFGHIHAQFVFDHQQKLQIYQISNRPMSLLQP